MELSRRVLLSMVPATALAGVAEPSATAADTRPATGRVPASAPAADDGAAAGAGTAADDATVLANTVAMLAGTPESNAHPAVAAKLNSIQSTAQSHLTALGKAGDGELFAGLPLGTSDPNLTKSYQFLYEIALATCTPAGTPGTPGTARTARTARTATSTAGASGAATSAAATPGPATAATAAPGALVGDADVQRQVIDALVHLHDAYYGDQSKGYYGNWFNWEIGISQHVSKTLVLLKDQLAAYRPDLTATYITSMDAYLRNGKNGDVDLDSRFHTGANLADITTNRILQGAVLGDDARITKAVSDQLTVLATVDPYHLQHEVTDGFYPDGSFIQHASVAYTGTYGVGLLSRLVQTIKMLDGTGYLGDADPVGVAHTWVAAGFAPVIFEGWMMEVVKGRGASRTSSGYGAVSPVVEGVVDLSSYTTGSDATALKGYVKFLGATSKVPLDPTRFVSPVSVARYADIVADASVPARDLKEPSYTVALNAMDRTVHRRPGYAFALARSSSRISKYEYMSGENLMPWFLGDGAHYLYLPGQDQTAAYGADYYAAVSPYLLAGVTAPVETRRTVPELYGTQWYDNPAAGFTSSSETQNTYVYFPRGTAAYSGGATLGGYAAAGLVQSDDAAYAAKQAGELPDDFVVYQNAAATKSWFLLDDEIVMLAAGVGDPAGRGVTTTVDSRIAGASEALTLTGQLTDGSAWPGLGNGTGAASAARSDTAPLAWLRYANADQHTAVGYVFLAGPRGAARDTGAGRPDPTATLETVAQNRRIVNASNPNTQVTKQVFTLYVAQAPGAPNASMAHVLVPNATEEQLRSYTRGPLSVLANTPQVQAIEHTGLGLLAANAFTPGVHQAGRRLSLDGAVSVLLRESTGSVRGGQAAGTLSVALSDPTTERDTVAVTVHGRALTAVTADDAVSVRRVAGGTRIEAVTRHAYGRSFTVTLR